MHVIKQVNVHKQKPLIVDFSKKPKSKIVVLRPQIERLQVEKIIDKNKTKSFRRFLKTPKPHEIHMHSLTLIYEPLMILSGKYNADFFRNASHEVKVDQNVKEIIFEDGIFLSSNFSSLHRVGERLRKNTVAIKLEEHVFVEKEMEIVLDHHGKERNFSYKVNTKDIEKYPKQVLKKNIVRKFEITEETAIKKLVKSLQTQEEFDNVRDLNEDFKVNEIVIIYVPIYETRLIGPKKKVEILQYDAIKKKLL